MKRIHFMIAGFILIVFGLNVAQAGVSPNEAAKLKTALTPMGAERAGNDDGTIPEWTGGYKKLPEGSMPGDWTPDPYAEDKILFTIDAGNYQQYSDKLSDGQIELFKRHPETYKMHIYPTRRSAAAPEWVYENTYNNALNASLVDGGNGVENACGGIPFPIPQNGSEVVWNTLMRWMGESIQFNFDAFLSYANGSFSQTGSTTVNWQFPYYNGSSECGGMLLNFDVQYNYPPRRKGEIILVNDPINQLKTPRDAWQYIPGQRRVRRAPTVAYDTPDGAVTTYDDAFQYNGSPDRYDWKLIGKKEMYVIYNGYKLYSSYGKKEASPDDLVKKGAPNPEYVRWELHRVWVVEGTLKDGKRHVYAKRVFYVDEDAWLIMLQDRYDAKGELWRFSYINAVPLPEGPVVEARNHTTFDFQAGQYLFNYIDNSPVKLQKKLDDSFFTPQGIRKRARR